MRPSSAPIPRVGARALIITPEHLVLLVGEQHLRDGARSHRRWLTPGGGVDEGEALAAAAAREIWEETGHHLAVDAQAQPVHRTVRRWTSLEGLEFEQEDHFFLVRVDAPFVVDPAALTPEEVALNLSSRWWTIEELERTEDEVVPADLGTLLRRLLWHQAP